MTNKKKIQVHVKDAWKSKPQLVTLSPDGTVKLLNISKSVAKALIESGRASEG